MSFRINQNIGAMTALNNLQHTQMGIGKSIEKLSTGLRIVRAADDPSGLVISERFRAQVEGIGQAIRNSQDGINMVQTAEGALDEVSQILRDMRNVAIHAANTGPNDTETLQADQNQIAESIKTLDRIASTTQFGAKKILDGSSGVQGTVTDANVQFVGGSTETQAGTYAVEVTQHATKGSVSSRDTATGDTLARSTASATATGDGNALSAAETITIDGNDFTSFDVELDAGDTVSDVVDKINASSDAQEAGVVASANGDDLVLNTTEIVSGAAGSGNLSFDITDNTDGETVIGDSGADTLNNATSATKLSQDELLTFSNGTNTVNVSLTEGTSMAAAVSQINSALDNASIGVTASFDESTGAFTLENDEFGGDSTVTNTFSSNRDGRGSTGLAATAGASYNIAEGQAGTGSTAGTDVAGSIGGFAATGSGQFLSGDDGTDVEGLQIKYSGSTTPAANDAGSITVVNNSLTFQIGAFAGQTAELAIGNMSSSNLGTDTAGTTTLNQVNLSSIDVSSFNGEGAQDAIKVIDAAISQVTELRSEIGSFQKDILESTVSTLGVARQNLASSESNIRDADFAEEMMKFSKSQILSQTGMSMLTQANQSGQAVLSLFR